MKRIEFLRKSVFGLGIIPTLPFWIKSFFSKPSYTLSMFEHDIHKPGGVLDLWADGDTPFMRFIAEYGVKQSLGDPDFKMFEYRGEWTEIRSTPVWASHNID